MLYVDFLRVFFRDLETDVQDGDTVVVSSGTNAAGLPYTSTLYVHFDTICKVANSSVVPLPVPHQS